MLRVKKVGHTQNNCVFLPSPGRLSGLILRGAPCPPDFGALLLRGIDRQIDGALTAAIQDKRHQSYIDHPLRDLLAQRIYQIAAGMQTPMTPIVSAMTPCSNLGGAAALGSDPRFGECSDVLSLGAPNRPAKDLYRLTGLCRPLYCQLRRAPRRHCARPRSLR